MTTRSDSDVRQDAGELSTREASPQKELPVKPDKPAPVPPSQHHPFAVQVSTWLLHYPRLRMVVYATASLIIGLTQGLGINLVSSNLPGIQGSLGISNVESYWLVAAYTATSVTGTILLYKIRTQFGFRRFGEYGLLFLLWRLWDRHSLMISRPPWPCGLSWVLQWRRSDRWHYFICLRSFRRLKN